MIVSSKDGLIWKLLQDPDFRVSATGEVFTRRALAGSGQGHWRSAGCATSSRGGEKWYWRVRYCGTRLYRNRIVFAATRGYLRSDMTVDHIDMNSLNDNPANLRLITVRKNTNTAREFYRRTGMSAMEAKAHWINGIRGIQRGTDPQRKTGTL